MKKKRLPFLIGIFLLIAIVAGIFILKRRSKEEFKTTKVIKKDLVKAISASGKIKSEKEIDLKFQTSGKLTWVGVKEGDQVKKWQAIASLDKRELEKTLKKELVDYMNERWNFEQDRDTYDITTDDLDRYTLTNAVRRILEKAQFDLNRDVLDVEIANIVLELATLVTPIDGIVTHIDVPVSGVNITPAKAIFTVADPDEVIFEANVDEVDIGQIKEGQETILTLDAYLEETIESKVIQVGFEAITTRGGGTAFPVKIQLPENKNLGFKLGMNGDLEIILDKKENALVVPASSIMKRKEKYYVFVVKNGVAKKQEVKIGLETETETEIRQGLNEKDEVISEKLSQVKDGQRIK